MSSSDKQKGCSIYMKIAICDDEIRDIQKLKEHINTHSLKHEVIEFTSARPMIKRIENSEHFDLLFLDIKMPDEDGWRIAKQLKDSKVKIYIAMVTIMEDYITGCFDRVDWFATKPVNETRVHKIIDKSQEKLFPEIISFYINKVPINLALPEMRYFEVQRNYIYVHTLTKVYKIRTSLAELKNKLNREYFAQTHQSYIINLEYYAEINGNNVILESGEPIPLSRNKKSAFIDSLSDYIREALKMNENFFSIF